MEAKKAKKLLKDTVDEMEECGPTTAFAEAYDKQLDLEAVRVETEPSREERENTQYLMTMLERLIAKATTPDQKSEYEAELDFSCGRPSRKPRSRPTLPPPRRPPPCLPPLPRVLRLPAAAHLEGRALEGRSLHTHDHVTGGICLMIVLHTRNCAFLGEVLVVLKKLAPQNCVSTGIKIFVLWRTKKNNQQCGHAKPGLQSVAALSQRNCFAPHWSAPLTRRKCSVSRSLLSSKPVSTSVSATVSVALQ
jgi:hypothetical protein